jgi:hypothetical protein
MNKMLSYIKHFFMLNRSEAYRAQTYKNYTGFGFTRFKHTDYFLQPKIRNPGYLKSEVAMYSEMTKAMLLVGMIILAAIVVWWDIRIVKVIVDPQFRTKAALAILVPSLVVLNFIAINIYPRAVFLIKNFRTQNG